MRLAVLFMVSGCTLLYGGPRGDGSDCGDVVCNLPPPNFCVDSSTLFAYAALGTCRDRLCTYSSYSVVCMNGCQDGACVGDDPCNGIVCITPPQSYCANASTRRSYSAAGTCQGGMCSYAATDTGCTNGCSQGACNGDACAGVLCVQPPAPTCVDANTRRSYSAGTCNAGACSYAPVDTSCAGGCLLGACNGDPCVGVTCNQPPSPVCADANTRRSYSAGSCSAGGCSYAFTDTPCAHGCSGGVCNGDPCVGVTCDQPPAPSCADANTRRTYSPGSCSGGTCSYTPVDTTCPAPANASPVCAGGACDFQCNPGFQRQGTQCVAQKPVAIAVTAGSGHSCALMSDHTIRCWGDDFSGQLGDNRSGANADSSVPVLVQGITTAIAVGAGDSFTCAVLMGGTAKCWGSNQYGDLGDNSGHNSSVPVDVQGLSGASAVSVGIEHVCALLANGGIYCWGHNASGELGDGSTIDRHAPAPVQGIGGYTAVGAGGHHSCALVVGKPQCWGLNSLGELGTTSPYQSQVPVTVPGITGASALAVGYDHSCALVGATVVCWGATGDSLGVAGTPSPTPAPVPGLSAIAVFAGGFHNCAVLTDTTVRCWGDNEVGQLGNNSTTRSDTPVVVQGLSGVTSVAGGYAHTCALIGNGTVQCWGDNFHGELGNQSTTNSSVPVMVKL
jgi:alpha-tubulin suppressor-like RCC1 family protein